VLPRSFASAEERRFPGAVFFKARDNGDILKVLFSSWNDQIVDNRGRAQSDWAEANVRLPLEFDVNNRIHSFMGWSGIILANDGYDIVDLSTHYIKSIQEASCGRCFPCRIGTAVMQDLLEVISRGRGEISDIEKLERLGADISDTSKCSIGQTGPIPILHALKYFKGDFEKRILGGENRKVFQYVSKTTAPCMNACPTGMDIPGYIEAIREGRPGDSLELIRQASPVAASLGRACFHPCEKSCVRFASEEPVSICKLKRYAWDYDDQHEPGEENEFVPHSKQTKVAVIGAGPAGLSFAYYMALAGYSPTVFEALPVPGGMAAVGIPEYRIPKEVLRREVDYIEKQGVEIRYGVRVGTDILISELRRQGYRGFFVGIGAHQSKKMGAQGEDEDYQGFVRGIDFLRDCIIEDKNIVNDKNVIVVGGGNVAMDCCRTPIRQGAKKVTVVYRRTKKELPADPHEVHDSEIEGVNYEFLAAPKRIIAEKGKVTGLECARMQLGEPDASGRRSPVEIKGSEFIIPADIIIQAIGQDCDMAVLSGEEGVSLTKWQTIQADPDTLQTNVPDIFVGGDVFNGPMTLVDACGNARRAAQTMDLYLSGKPVEITASQKMEKVFKKLGVQDTHAPGVVAAGRERIPMNTIAMEQRTGSFQEVETGYTMEQALEEAARCMRCYQVGLVALEEKK